MARVSPSGRPKMGCGDLIFVKTIRVGQGILVGPLVQAETLESSAVRATSARVAIDPPTHSSPGSSGTPNHKADPERVIVLMIGRGIHVMMPMETVLAVGTITSITRSIARVGAITTGYWGCRSSPSIPKPIRSPTTG